MRRDMGVSVDLTRKELEEAIREVVKAKLAPMTIDWRIELQVTYHEEYEGGGAKVRLYRVEDE